MLSTLYLIWMIAVKLSLYSPFMVEGDSMLPTLPNQEIFLIDKSVENKPEDLKRGDIIVFSFDDKYYYVKRLIGLPGEYLKINAEGVWIKGSDGNFQLLNEFYLGGRKFKYGDERYFIVPEKQYFVLGDNRDHSKDSRYFEPPYVQLGQIYGKYIFP